MGRAKKTYSHYDIAINRLANLKSISTTLDVGNGLTVGNYETAINVLRQKLDDYNMALSSVDEKYNVVQEVEKGLKDLSERMLAGVAVKFGKNSHQYEMAGGVRKSERKKPTPKSSSKSKQ